MPDEAKAPETQPTVAEVERKVMILGSVVVWLWKASKRMTLRDWVAMGGFLTPVAIMLFHTMNAAADRAIAKRTAPIVAGQVKEAIAIHEQRVGDCTNQVAVFAREVVVFNHRLDALDAARAATNSALWQAVRELRETKQDKP